MLTNLYKPRAYIRDFTVCQLTRERIIRFTWYQLGINMLQKLRILGFPYLETILAHDDGHIRNQASEILKSARVWQLPDVHLQTVQFLQGVSAHLDGGE